MKKLLLLSFIGTCLTFFSCEGGDESENNSTGEKESTVDICDCVNAEKDDVGDWVDEDLQAACDEIGDALEKDYENASESEKREIEQKYLHIMEECTGLGAEVREELEEAEPLSFCDCREEGADQELCDELYGDLTEDDFMQRIGECDIEYSDEVEMPEDNGPSFCDCQEEERDHAACDELYGDLSEDDYMQLATGCL